MNQPDRFFTVTLNGITTYWMLDYPFDMAELTHMTIKSDINGDLFDLVEAKDEPA